MKFLSHIVALILFPSSLIAQIAFDNIKAPELAIKEWIGEKPALKGKTIILEFWATWCGGCIEAIPHINNLSKAYAEKDVLFISINSHDSMEKVEKFMSKTTFNTHVVLDDSMKTASLLRVRSIPQTFLIDKNGYLRWQGTPGLLTNEFLQNFIEKDEVLIPKFGNPLLYSFNISFTKDRSVSTSSYKDNEKFGFTCRNKGLTAIISQLFIFLDYKDYQYRFTGKIPLEPALDLELMSDKAFDREFIFNDVINKLSAMFEFNVRTVQEDIELWHLNVVDEKLFLQALSVDQDQKFTFKETDNEFELFNCEAYRLGGIIEELSDKIVENKLNTNNKLSLTLPRNDFESLKKTLSDKYGLGLERNIEGIEVKVVEFK